MQIRLGYACISETVEGTSSSTYPYSRYMIEKDSKKLEHIICSNLFHLKELFLYNNKNNIHFFRISSNLIPLATKNDVEFDYYTPYQRIYRELVDIIREKNMRVDFHPSEYCVINSTKKDVVFASFQILEYHYSLLRYLQIEYPLLVLHVGSCEFGKEKSITRFIHNFYKLPKEIQKVIAIENDDKSYTVEDCLFIANKLSIPVVFDYHHHLCNPSNNSLEEILILVLNTWKGRPKMHFSSPKSKLKKEIRSHHDYINSNKFIQFLECLKSLDTDVDIMIEAKKKDEALFRLVRELKYKTDFYFLDDTSFIITKNSGK